VSIRAKVAQSSRMSRGSSAAFARPSFDVFLDEKWARKRSSFDARATQNG